MQFRGLRQSTRPGAGSAALQMQSKPVELDSMSSAEVGLVRDRVDGVACRARAGSRRRAFCTKQFAPTGGSFANESRTDRPCAGRSVTPSRESSGSSCGRSTRRAASSPASSGNCRSIAGDTLSGAGTSPVGGGVAQPPMREPRIRPHIGRAPLRQVVVGHRQHELPSDGCDTRR